MSVSDRCMSGQVASAVSLSLGALEPLPARIADGSLVVITGISGQQLDIGTPEARTLIAWLRRWEKSAQQFARDSLTLTRCCVP